MKPPPDSLAAVLGSSVLEALTHFPALDLKAGSRTLTHWNQKTKPAGSLGRLEEMVLWLAQSRGDSELKDDAFHLCVYAGSHGVAEEGVSAFPPEVNVQMIENFRQGGAAINTLCEAYSITMKVEDIGVATPTGNIAREEAMSEEGFSKAFLHGWNSVPQEATLFAVGEMGIANTTVATAIIAAVLGEEAEALTGPGTGIDAVRKAHKAQVIQRALDCHAEALTCPWETMRCLGGRELAAMSGALLRATSLRIPVMLDGLIATAAAAIAFEIQPEAVPFCMAGHRSAEPAHIRILERYQLSPLLDMQMRLGEGTGAALAMGMMRGALNAYREMASFDDAQVSRL